MTFSTLNLFRSLALAGLTVSAVSCVSQPAYPPDGNVFIRDNGRPKYGFQGTNSPGPGPSKPSSDSPDKPKNTGEDPSKLHDSNTNNTPPPTTPDTTAGTNTPPPTTGSEDVKATKPASGTSLPYGTPVIGEKGYVYSPYAPDKGKVDVKDIPSNTKVECPYTGKIFRVP